MLVADRSVGTQDPTIVGQAPPLQLALAQARRSARCSHPVLIIGETGTGKELLARFVHAESERADGPFVRLNCAALPDALLEDELFGHERGAYTGAHADRLGRFERARAGTLFLDEVGELSLTAQAKLLRVLETGEFERLGGEQSMTSDARIVAATHRDLRAECQAGRFRWDLYYRLDVLALRLPPLRERGDDVLRVANHLLERLTDGARLSTGAEAALQQHPWPGNVRELRNVLLRAATYAQGGTLTADDLDLPAATPRSEERSLAGRRLADIEREAILQTLDQSPSQEAAARLLGVSSRTLRNKLTRYRAQGHVA